MSSDQSGDLVEELREEIDAAPVIEQDPLAVSVAIERYERALHHVLDKLHETPTRGSAVALINRNRMVADLADALGIELRFGR